MEEVKFKAWDKVFKRFVPVACLYFDKHSKFIGVYMGDEVDEEWTVVRKEHLELVQFTGIKDKNDVEVYKGDLLELEFVLSDYKLGPFPVTFESYQWSADELFFSELVDLLREGKLTFEVVGNIYENPELLNQ